MKDKGGGAVRGGSNFVAEWFGHRVYPRVVSSERSLVDQRKSVCPFLSRVQGEVKTCIKSEASRGVCSVSATSNGHRQDWIVCPYRAFVPETLQSVARWLYQMGPDETLHLYAAPLLASTEVQDGIRRHVGDGQRVLAYFDEKLGGEISLSGTAASPEIAFDVTFIEITDVGGQIALGRFAVSEIQTMDFHGTYREAVRLLKNALELHETDFPDMVGKNSRWMGKDMEGPNIANVFKRTFYQLMFKFELAKDPDCAGCALLLPKAVWDSWRPFLANPDLHELEDGTIALSRPGGQIGDEARGSNSMIFVFDPASDSDETPNPLRIVHRVRTTTEQLSAFALVDSPRAAMEQARAHLFSTIQFSLSKYWRLDSFESPLESRSRKRRPKRGT